MKTKLLLKDTKPETCLLTFAHVNVTHESRAPTWQQANPPVNTQAALLLARPSLTLAGQQGRMFGQQGVLSLQTLRRHLLPQRGEGRVGRTQLQTSVQRHALGVSQANSMSFHAVWGGRRERKHVSRGRQHTWEKTKPNVTASEIQQTTLYLFNPIVGSFVLGYNRFLGL